MEARRGLRTVAIVDERTQTHQLGWPRNPAIAHRDPVADAQRIDTAFYEISAAGDEGDRVWRKPVTRPEHDVEGHLSTVRIGCDKTGAGRMRPAP